MLTCIAREFGSGSHEIGKSLAETLGFQFYDQALVTEAVSRSSISSKILEKNRRKERKLLATQRRI